MNEAADPLLEAARLLETGQLDGAEQACGRSLQADAESARGWFLLGAIKHAQGQIEQALAAFQRASRLQPQDVNTLNAEAAMLALLGRMPAALERYRGALAAAPDNPQTLTNLAIALEQIGDAEGALAHYEQALVHARAFYPALLNRGALLLKLQHFEDALQNNHRLVAAHPNQPDAHFNRAEALLAVGRYQLALEACERALALEPRHAGAWIDLGVAAAMLARFDQAHQAFERARALDPERVDAMARLIDITSHRGMRELDGRLIYLYKLYLAQEACDWKRRDEWVANCEKLIAQALGRADEIRDFNLPFRTLGIAISPHIRLALARSVAQEIGKAAAGSAPLQRPRVARSDGRIRIGYVSPDFRVHPCGLLTRNLYRLHDRSEFSVYAYAVYPGDDSAVHHQIVAGCDVFRACSDLSARAIAEMIADDGIDIVVDLAGYTNFSRPEVFAHRPAPIQVGYLGFAGTTGADYIDYALVDATVCPPGSEQFWSEQLAYLPETYFIGDGGPTGELPLVSRAEVGLPQDAFVFCCFNNNYKFEPLMFEVWMRLLKALPGAVLWMQVQNDSAGGNLRREAQARGIAAERIIDAPFCPREWHLARYQLADLFLDTWGYNAHTTGIDALCAGLPVVTCPGAMSAARVGASLLRAAGTPETIATDFAHYERIALSLATRPAELQRLRQKLRANFASAPLFDIPRSVVHIEDAYREMSRRMRAGEPPRSFAVPPRPRRD